MSAPAPILEVRGLARRFAGLEALRGVSFAVGEGELLAVIGPNGAGKTTLLNIVAGSLRPTAGTVRLRGRTIDGRPPHAVNRAGIARTFQTLELFPGLSVRENVMAAGIARGGAGLLAGLVGWPSVHRARSRLRALAAECLELVGLDRLADVPASVLPAGSRRLLGIARALATGAELLLLDEPGAGLNSAEKAHLAVLIGRLPGLGKTVLFVEHDMALVGELARRVVVLDRGELIADGSPEAVRTDPRVLAAYLGGSVSTRGSAPMPTRASEGAKRHAAASLTVLALAVEGLEVAYGGLQALRGVSLEVRAGEIVALVGANGAGKSTLLRAISGVAPVTAGTIRLEGRSLAGQPPEAIVQAGVSHVPEGRELFPSLTVWDNLVLGRAGRFFARGGLVAGALRQQRGARELEALAEQAFVLFPVLRERRRQLAGTLSGGEGQMLAIARALMSSPRVLMLDEPSLGLAPQVAHEILARLSELRREGLAILLVEQNARAALEIADRGYVLETGRVVAAGPGAALAGDPEIARAYLGREATLLGAAGPARDRDSETREAPS